MPWNTQIGGLISENATVDSLDRQIIHALGVNGRVSFRQLAAALDASEQTISRRYSQLRAAGVVQVVALPRPSDDDLGQLLRLHVQPGAGVKLAQALARRDEVAWVRLAAAGAEVICGVRAENPEHRDRLILDQIPNTGRVTGVVSYAILHHFHPAGRADWDGFDDPLDDQQRSALTPPAAPVPSEALRDSDRSLALALAQDARRSASDIAASLAQPESTVRRRLEALLRTRSIQLDLDVDTTALGYPIVANLYLEVDPRQLNSIGHSLAEQPQTMFVAAVTGPANLFAVCACRTISELYAYITETVAQMPSIRRVETSLTVGYLKRARMPAPRIGEQP